MEILWIMPIIVLIMVLLGFQDMCY